MNEIEKSFQVLAKNLEIWVNANGLVLNLKKTNYMIFANQKVKNCSFKPNIFNYDILRQNSARFLGVIINENLIWKDYILSVMSFMLTQLKFSKLP